MSNSKNDKKSFIWNNSWLRRTIYFSCFVGIWYLLYLSGTFSEILLPGPHTVFDSLIDNIINGGLIHKTLYSLYLIGKGLLISFVLAAILTALSIQSKWIKDITKTIIAVVDPLPGLALLPLAILWLGIGEISIIFVIVHSVLWPVLINTMSGFDGVPKIYREIGENIGLKQNQMILKVFAPASVPFILMGVKTGWARAWRALISAEMVFGATGIAGGLGWDIYIKRSFMDVPGMFASLIVIMLIGIAVEDLIFKKLEKNTIVKWGVRA